MNERRGVALFLVGVATVLFSPFLLFGKVFVAGDFLNFLYPWRTSTPPHNLEQLDTATLFYPLSNFVNEQLKAGDLPLWDPAIFCGYPLVASGYGGLLYPPKMLAHWLLSTPVAVSLLLFVHTAAMGLGMYGWLLNRGLSPKGAGLGGLCWMLSGFNATWMQLDSPLMAVYLPLMLWSFDRRSWAALTVCGALCLHAGHLQMVFYMGLILIFHALQQMALRREWKLLLPFGLSGVGVVALAAPTLLPFLELLTHSERPAFSWAELQRFSSGLPKFVLTMFNPDFLGNPSRGLMLNRSLANYPFCEYADYIGLIPLAFALLAIRKAGKTRWGATEIYGWTGFGVIAILLAAMTPLYRLVLFLLPVLSQAIPGRLILITIFCGCVLAGHGFEIWCRDESSRRSVAGFVGVVSGATAVFLGWLAWWLFATPGMAKAWLGREVSAAMVKIPPVMPGESSVDLWISGLITNYLRNPQMLMTVLAGLLLWGMIKRPRPILLGLFVALDLLIFISHYNSVVEPDTLYPSTPGIAYLQQQDGLFRVDKQGAAFYNTLIPFHLQLLTGYSSVVPSRYVQTLTASQSRSATMRSMDINNFASPILSALNLRYLMQGPQDLPAPSGWTKVYDGEVRIFENPLAQPRAYVRSQLKFADSFSQTLDLLKDPSFDPALEAVVEGPPTGPLSADALKSSAQVTRHEPNLVALSAELDGTGLLVLADSFYPGWICRDATGRELPIVPVNGVGRGVYLEVGRHDLEFRFQPRSYSLGLKLCAFGFLWTLGLAAWGGVWRKKELIQAPPLAGSDSGP